MRNVPTLNIVEVNGRKHAVGGTYVKTVQHVGASRARTDVVYRLECIEDVTIFRNRPSYEFYFVPLFGFNSTLVTVPEEMIKIKLIDEFTEIDIVWLCQQRAALDSFITQEAKYRSWDGAHSKSSNTMEGSSVPGDSTSSALQPISMKQLFGG